MREGGWARHLGVRRGERERLGAGGKEARDGGKEEEPAPKTLAYVHMHHLSLALHGLLPCQPVGVMCIPFFRPQLKAAKSSKKQQKALCKLNEENVCPVRVLIAQ